MVEIINIVQGLRLIIGTLNHYTERLTELAGEPVSSWVFPVGSAGFPPEQWYCAQYHTYNGTTGHTGLDLNVEVWPRGGIDIGEPVRSVADGVVHDVGYSPQSRPGVGWLGVVVIRVQHEGDALWVRYAHLAEESILVKAGDPVHAGQGLGVLGDYRNAANQHAAHLHFDMARDSFGWAYWRAKSVRWVDPVPILKQHLDPKNVDLMLNS